MNIRPYVSVDVESTGLETSEGHHLLSVGMVFDDGAKDTTPGSMPHLHLAVACEEIVGSPYAIAMNAKLISVIAGYGNETIDGMTVRTGNVVCDQIIDFIQNATEYAQMYDVKNGITRPEKIQVLAKNGQKLDIPMLNKLFSDYGRAVTNGFSNLISHRAMDLGSMYVGKYGTNVSLSVINKDLDRHDVTHNALEDAYDNVAGLRNLFN